MINWPAVEAKTVSVVTSASIGSVKTVDPGVRETVVIKPLPVSKTQKRESDNAQTTAIKRSNNLKSNVCTCTC